MMMYIREARLESDWILSRTLNLRRSLEPAHLPNLHHDSRERWGALFPHSTCGCYPMHWGPLSALLICVFLSPDRRVLFFGVYAFFLLTHMSLILSPVLYTCRLFTTDFPSLNDDAMLEVRPQTQMARSPPQTQRAENQQSFPPLSTLAWSFSLQNSYKLLQRVEVRLRSSSFQFFETF